VSPSPAKDRSLIRGTLHVHSGRIQGYSTQLVLGDAPEGGGESLETLRVIATLGVSYFSSGKKTNKFIRQPAQPLQISKPGDPGSKPLPAPVTQRPFCGQ
jgi:hypothetical protein